MLRITRKPPLTWLLSSRSAVIGATLAACAMLAVNHAAADENIQTDTVASECGEIILAEFSWPTSGLSSRLLELILADGYGCEVRRSPATPSRAIAAIAATDQKMREADKQAAPLGGAPINPPPGVIAVGAQINSSADVQPGVLVGSELYGGLDRGGWFVPSWLTTAKPDLRLMENLARHSAAFAHSSKEKPRLYLCPRSWPCHSDDRALVDMLGLADHFEIVTPPSGDALTASLVDAWRQRRPWIGSYWTPSATVAEYAMTRLDSGALEICPSGRTGEAASDAACRPPHRTSPRVTLYPKSLERRAPRVAAALRRFSLPPETMLEALAWRATSNADLNDAALQLLDSRPALWRTWLDETARRRFENALNDRLQALDQRTVDAQMDRRARERESEKGHEPKG